MSVPARAPTAAMVMAAGLGTRMRPLTDTLPKPLIRVAGRTLIDHTLALLAEAGIQRTVVNLHYRGAQLRAHLAGRETPAIALSEEPELLDTGGGLVKALPLLGEAPFAVLNSDAIWAGANPLTTLAGAWAPERMDALLLLVPHARARGFTRPGDFFFDPPTGLPSRRGQAPTAPLIYTGAQILAPCALDNAPAGAFSLNVIWDRLLAAGRLAATIHPSAWADVGTPQGIEIAEDMLAEAGA
ncbi:MAG: nucleotidyltransferase family protein [Pseudomonadota bacterium]